MRNRSAVGVVQGRLSPQEGEFIQDFPTKWREEFKIASSERISHIEWILTHDTLSTNPIITEKVGNLPMPSKTGVMISGICVDALVHDNFTDPAYRDNVWWTAMTAATRDRGVMQAGHLIIPLLEKSSVKEMNIRNDIVKELTEFTDLYPFLKISLETDLDVDDMIDLLGKLPKAMVTLDLGNLTKLGYDVRKHIEVYGNKIYNVHMKDCVKGGTTVPLGEGDTDFSVIRELNDCKAIKFITLQAARIPGMSELDQFLKYEKFLEDKCQELFKEE